MSQGVSASTSTGGASSQAALNQFSNTVLPLPRGPTKTTLCGGAAPPHKSPKQRESTACWVLRPANSGGAAPSPGANKRCSVDAMMGSIRRRKSGGFRDAAWPGQRA